MLRIAALSIAMLVIFSANLPFLAQDTARPMTIRLIDGSTGQRMGNKRLLLFFGASPDDVGFQRGRKLDLNTDANGEATLPISGTASAYLQVFVDFHTLCQSNTNGHTYPVTEIMNSGAQSPNDCGKTVLPIFPGQLTIYARRSTFREKMAR